MASMGETSKWVRRRCYAPIDYINTQVLLAMVEM